MMNTKIAKEEYKKLKDSLKSYEQVLMKPNLDENFREILMEEVAVVVKKLEVLKKKLYSPISIADILGYENKEQTERRGR